MGIKRFKRFALLRSGRRRSVAALVLSAFLAGAGVAFADYSPSDRLDDFTHDPGHWTYPTTYRTRTLWGTVSIMSAMGLLVSDAIGTLLGPILKPLESIAGISIKIDGEYGQIKEMIKTYNDNYAKDHAPLSEDKRISVETDLGSLRKKLEDAGAISFAGTSAGARAMLDDQNPGYKTVEDGDYASRYRERADRWQNTAFAMLEAANSQAAGVTSAQAQIKTMNDVSNEADGYIRIMQAGGQQRNYLNRNLVQARFDVMMQLDAQFKVSMEKIQDDADATSAFDRAVKGWTAPAGAAGSY
jgi:P-type conjugative transfer protein TrbJ